MAGRNQTLTLIAALVGVLSIPDTGSAADAVADFYKGKNLIIFVASEAGSGYDVYARQLVAHLARHIPGNPNVVVKNMPGAGGTIMVNYLANKANNDGSEIGAAYGSSLIEPVLDEGKATKYDSRKMDWIGNISGQVGACFTWKASSKVKSIEDARRTEVIMSATAPSATGTVEAALFNLLAGTKFKIVTGYNASEKSLAVERGEAEGSCAAYESLIADMPDWVRGPIAEHKVNWLAVESDHESLNLPGVPPITNYIDAEDDKQIIRIMERQLTMGRPYLAPSGVPADRLRALRDGFMATMADPAYVTEARKLGMLVDPSDHVAMEKLIDDTYSIPRNVILRALTTVEKAKTSLGAPSVSNK